MATLTQVTNYIASIRVGIADFDNKVCLKERLGHTDTFCSRQKLILNSAYLDCVVDYFTPFLDRNADDGSYDTNNFFTTEEIRDCMQHINNLTDCFYMIEL